MRPFYITLFLFFSFLSINAQNPDETALRTELKEYRTKWDNQREVVRSLRDKATQRWLSFSETCGYRDVECHEQSITELQAIVAYARSFISSYDQECKEWNRINTEMSKVQNKLFGDPISSKDYCSTGLEDVIDNMNSRVSDIQRDLKQAKIANESFKREERSQAANTTRNKSSEGALRGTSDSETSNTDRLEEINAENEATSQAYDQMGDEISNELAAVFTGDLQPQNIMNITNSILNSGLLESANAIGAVGIGGGVAAAAIGILGNAKEDKINSNVNTLNTKSEELKEEYKKFQEAVEKNDDAGLLKSHERLLSIEQEMVESADYLIKKADQNDLVKLQNSIIESRRKRSSGVTKVKLRLESAFHAMTSQKRKSYVESGALSPQEIALLKNPQINDGLARYYDDNWELIKKGAFKNGKEEGLWSIYKGGGLYFTVSMKYGITDGPSTIYYPDGTVKSKVDYKNGKLDGVFTSYFPSGNLSDKVTYMEGKPEGLYISYYENGQEKKVRTYTQGSLQGAYKAYHKNGNVQMDAMFNDHGIRTGFTKVYDNDGNLTSTIDFGKLDFSTEDGVLLKDYRVNDKAFKTEALFMPDTDKIKALLKDQMTAVEGGSFDMGGKLKRKMRPYINYPAVTTTVDGYSISKFEVTHELWQAVMGYLLIDDEAPEQPVCEVDYREILVFFRYLNAATGKTYRLPTEAEWEFAARGGNKSEGYDYSGSNKLKDVAWVYLPQSLFEKKTEVNYTQPVGTLEPNELGLYDMSGNVSEICSDWIWTSVKDRGITGYSSIRPSKAESTENLKVVKGGGLGQDYKNNESFLFNNADSYSPVNRAGIPSDKKPLSGFIGFRIAHD